MRIVEEERQVGREHWRRSCSRVEPSERSEEVVDAESLMTLVDWEAEGEIADCEQGWLGTIEEGRTAGVGRTSEAFAPPVGRVTGKGEGSDSDRLGARTQRTGMDERTRARGRRSSREDRAIDRRRGSGSDTTDGGRGSKVDAAVVDAGDENDRPTRGIDWEGRMKARARTGSCLAGRTSCSIGTPVGVRWR
jgi:hypothetical protein